MNQTDLSTYLNYLKAFYRHRYVFIVVALLTMTLVTIYSYTIPKKYKADSTVFIETNVINQLVRGIAVTPDMDSRIRVLRYSILSRDLLTKTLTEIDAEIFTKSQAEQQLFISKLKERINIRIRGRELFTVSLVDKDPVFVQLFVNTLVSKYVEENISSKRDETYGANRFLQEQIDLFKKKLDEAENSIIKFRQQQGVYFSVDENAVLGEIRQYKEQIEQIQLDLDTMRARRVRLQGQLNSLSPTIDIFSGATGSNGLLVLERQLATLLLKYTENYPEVIRLKVEIETLKVRIAERGSITTTQTTSMTSVNPLHQQVQQQVFDVESELSALTAQKKSLERRILAREESLQDVPENRKKLGVLIQERDSTKGIYDQLLQRIGQSEVSKQMEISNKSATFRIVDPAILPKTPVSPNMIRMILLAIAAGIGCGLGTVFLLDTLDTSVKNPQQLENMGVHVMAIIPSIDDGITNAKIHRRDIIIYILTTLYFSIFVALLALELLKPDLIKHYLNLITTNLPILKH